MSRVRINRWQSLERLEQATDLVYAFWPREIDPPHFVAEDIEDLEDRVGTFIGGAQCDGCGNHSYRVEKRSHGHAFFAVCAPDPDEDPEFRHPDPCGEAYAIHLYNADDVVF